MQGISRATSCHSDSAQSRYALGRDVSQLGGMELRHISFKGFVVVGSMKLVLFGSRQFEEDCEKCGKWVGYHVASSVTMLANAYLTLKISILSCQFEKAQKAQLHHGKVSYLAN